MSEYYEAGSSQYADRTRISNDQVHREPHLLNLKVLRASRPSFTQSKDLFRDETSTEESASTSGFTLTPLLALPTAFGSINLGETFQGLIVAANDSPHDIYDASLRIEIQTANNRSTLWESQPPEKGNPRILKPGDSLEAPLLKFEIKEPGLHALSCSVSYWAPTRNLSFTPQPGAGERHMRSFRKLYKFQASNPLAVKTKVHTSRNAAAQLDEESGRTIFLEVQIQNTSPEALHFDQISLVPAEHQEVEDISNVPKGQLQPGDLLQCLYIVKSSSSHYQELLEKARHSGGVLPLGKLDIRWRTRMGDAGHLSTSNLVRRLPQMAQPPALPTRPTMQQPYSSLDPHQTPDKAARYREASPMHSPQLGAAGAFSPAVSPRLQHMDAPKHLAQFKNLAAKLTVLPFEKRSVEVNKPFDVDFKLSLTSYLRDTTEGRTTSRRLKIAIQHVRYTKQSNEGEMAAQPPPLSRMSLDSHMQTEATPAQSTRTSIETNKPLPAILSTENDIPGQALHETTPPPPVPLPQDHQFYFPPPVSTLPPTFPDASCSYYGNTLVKLDEIIINHQGPDDSSPSSELRTPGSSAGPEVRISLDSASTTDDLPLDEVMRARSAKRTENVDIQFKLQYLASESGIFKLGGLRVLLLEDVWSGNDSPDSSMYGLAPSAGASSSRRSLSSQATSSWSAGRHLPRWQSTNRSQRATFSSIQQHNTPSSHTTWPSQARASMSPFRSRRPYATIIELPTAAEDDLPEPLLQKGQEDPTTTIAITPAAEKQLAKIQAREKDPNLALRILVESGGCHGYSTKLQVADAVKDRQEDDYILSAKASESSDATGLLLVDAVTLGLIKGSTLDYATELIGSSFRLVDNPQAKGAGCGCGVSWELKL
ncbi:DUF974-domain-containing protein [Cystobasidium minutum MCA 4210]|uniref:DUF974-domain-containing protein n=1 Tax=Cystobasidium minutum MCA 4210 TaxID=1397322 RepID=UPI0034CD1AD5|eukprot:jgi/Rhomi1/210517/estExt_Genemark1.C_4_t10058